ncbi:MAG: metallophosphoesterase [Verrucomicrobia bacterium]|nr:metallophosphoesterase [Verrucomicrobiota bacterium]
MTPSASRRALLTTFWISFVLAAFGQQAEQALFRFGVVTDVQYADKPARGKRHYNESAEKLRACVADFNRRELAFVANLGDSIDGDGGKSATDIALIAGIFRQLTCPVQHVLGNHCLNVPRPALLKELGLKSPYYEFARECWRFLVLDGMDVSYKSPDGSKQAKEAQNYLEKNPKLNKYAGALGEEQMVWLREQLADAARQKQRVIVFCHHPILAAASSPGAVLWNAGEVEAALVRSGCVVAWINGHDHKGGYAFANGIYHLTVHGMIESPTGGNSYAIASVFETRIAIEGKGTTPSRVLERSGGLCSGGWL